MSALLTPHEERIAAQYARDYRSVLSYKERLGEKPYNTWGFWDADTSTYDQALDRMIARVVERGRIDANDRVLDVGCGTGASSLDIHALTGASVTGIDITSEALAFGRRRVEETRATDAVELRQMSATQLTFDPKSFTVVTAIDCGCHFDTRDDFFRQAAEVLEPGGRLVLLDLVEGEQGRRAIGGWLQRLLMSAWKIPAANRHGAPELVRRLEGVGFADVELRSVGAEMLPPATRFMRRAEFRKEYRKDFGLVGDVGFQLMLSAIGLVYRWRLADFVLVSAVKRAG